MGSNPSWRLALEKFLWWKNANLTPRIVLFQISSNVAMILVHLRTESRRFERQRDFCHVEYKQLKYFFQIRSKLN